MYTQSRNCTSAWFRLRKKKKKSRLADIGEAECYSSDCLNSTIGALSPSASVCVALPLLKEHISSSQRKQPFSSLQEKKVGQGEGYTSGKKKSLLTLELVLQNQLRVIHNVSLLNEFISECSYRRWRRAACCYYKKADRTHSVWGILSIIFIKYWF